MRRALLDADPARADKLAGPDLRRLVNAQCEPADRETIAHLVEVHRQLYGALATFDQCVAKQKAMAPLFRHWLGVASQVGRTRE